MMQINSTAQLTDKEVFISALHIFFGCRPNKIYQILFWLIFAKKRMLRIVNNYDNTPKPCERVLATLDIEVINKQEVVNEWMQSGVYSRSVIVNFDGKEELEKLYNLYMNNSDNNSFTPDSSSLFAPSAIDPTFALSIFEKISSISDKWYRTNSKFAFNYVLNRMQDLWGREFGEFIQPQEITTLVCQMLDASKGSVYNPYAGVCSYGIELDRSIYYCGQELNASTHLIAQLNIIMNDCDNAQCKQGDSVTEWDKEIEYDYIVSTPPFGMYIQQNGRRNNDQPNRVEEHFMLNAARDAKKVSIGVYSAANICMGTRAGRFSPIMELLQKDWLESVVLLPANLFHGTAIPTVIVVTNKDKHTPGVVRLVNASDCFLTERQRKNVLDVEAVNKLLYQECASNCVIDIETTELLNNGGMIYPPFYQYKDAVGEEIPSVRLCEVLERVISTERVNGGEKVFKFPSSYYGKPVLEVDGKLLDNIKEFSVARVYQVVTDDCVVISRKMRFQSVFLHPNGERVAISPNFDIYHLNRNIVLPSYLIGEMGKEYFVRQLKRYGDISFLHQLRREDFMSMRIHVTSIEEQLEQTITDSQQDINEVRNRLSIEYNERFDAFVKNQRQRKHAIQQVLGDILPAIENIQDFIDAKGCVAKDDIISRRSGKTFETYIENVHEQLTRVVNMVDAFTAQEVYGEKELFELSSFLEQYCSRKASLNVSFISSDGKVFVEISQKDLAVALDNLVDNARKYGFVDKERKDYEVRISLDQGSTNAVIHVANNGRPVSESISLERIFTWGEGKGSGTGCWHTKDILQQFRGDIVYKEFTEDPNGFVCDFQIVLPIVNTDEND